ncbi:hypothetical protein RB653_007348 [Dictyostelium firmibasis]|uniref:Nodulin-like domain-containing protein n=1 Tax=Dictyostelium firmibasis TaxID=79012 RepID=A0AAN7TUC9_9MYCE
MTNNKDSFSKLNDSNYSITTEEGYEEEERSLNESVDSIGTNNGKNKNSNSAGNEKNPLKQQKQPQSVPKKKDKSLHRFYKPPHIIKNVEAQRAMSLVWGILTILASGTLYGFSIISNEIRDKLEYSQTDIALAISFGDVGMYIGLTVGFFFDLFGPFFTNGLATVFYVVGCMGVWAIVKGYITSSVYLLSFFLFIIGQSSYGSFTACVVSNVHNYSIKHRGKISGVLVGMFALSAGVFGVIYKIFFKTNLEGYLLFIAILLSVVSFIATYIVRLVKIEGVEEPEVLNDDENNESDSDKQQHSKNSNEVYQYDDLNENQKYTISKDEEGSLGGSGSIITNGKNNNSSTNNDKSKLLGEGSSSSFSSSSSNSSPSNSTSNLSPPTIPIDSSNPNFLDGKRDVSGLKLLRMVEFWCLWIIYFFAGGCSIMFLNNIAIMSESLGEPESIQSNLVIVFSIGNLVGRVGMGFLSDLISKKVSRFWCVVLSSLIITLTHLMCAFELKPIFYPATFFTGIGYGGIVSIMVLLASFRFGSRRFGLNFGFLALSSASGALVFSTFSSKVYDRLSENSVDGQCFGNHCFVLSFIISFAFNLMSVIIGIFVIFYTKKTDLKSSKNKK